MKNIILTIVSLLILTFSTAAQQIKRIDNSSIAAAALTSTIQQLVDTAQVTGLVISILNNNQPVYTKAFGYADKPKELKMDTSTIFWSCSFSKAVFGYCVMRLVEKNVLDLDTPLVKYLSKPLPDYVFTKKTRGYQDIRNDLRYEKITARICLNHTSGLPNYRGFEVDGKLKIRFAPGTRYSYSGEGIYLLQFVIEQLYGKDYETIAREEVFQPLGMTHSSYVWQADFNNNHAVGHDSLQQAYEFDERTTAHAAGSMYTNITDYAKFMGALLQQKGLTKQGFNALFHSDVAILSRQQFGPNALLDDKTPATTPLWYGLGSGILKTPYGNAFFKEGHSEGWQHHSIGFPDKGIAVVIMTNSDQGDHIFKALLETTIGDTYTPWYWENYIPFDYVSK
ncbi:CubicO group peptidase, beta-lactamase class C family [Chitinophaga jiangningensis]|uniref:CubicO group peptidase, beta-lactamase class C family n=1 Tax=Chitinophaga jiangningensis TaxID=1419482 RepID=A0A1M7K0B1_9BACT|nr:serine hydrolase domain-containing protein [Chitinophaga jiangningensis]SHM58247.1 CubicO group peptidase, beta-lactamase class C family [Chitinophaga jiangningensis]